jgi:indolepyruvate ferredoxin oxidoreductase, beta subunit
MRPCLSEKGDQKGEHGMNAPSAKQQIIVSGVGGQGILFITRLLAETAIYKGLPVLTAETHGMAQRGGIVVSHLKIGGFSSPLIRPAMADALLLLKEENLQNHFFYLKPGGMVVVNAPSCPKMTGDGKLLWINADAMAKKARQPKSVNMILVGFAISSLRRVGMQPFCNSDDIRAVLHDKLAFRKELLKSALTAFEGGLARGEEVNI